MQRTWLHPGRAVRFGAPAGGGATLLVGEGIETVLSLVAAAPVLHAAAALSAGSLAAFVPPPAPHASSSPPTATPRASMPRPGSKPG